MKRILGTAIVVAMATATSFANKYTTIVSKDATISIPVEKMDSIMFTEDDQTSGFQFAVHDTVFQPVQKSIRTSTFEDNSECWNADKNTVLWSSKIDKLQYMGELYGSNARKFSTFYDPETQLLSGLTCVVDTTQDVSYGEAFWSGGFAVTNYYSNSYKLDEVSKQLGEEFSAWFETQLTVYDIDNESAGHNSAQCLIGYGYYDGSGFSSDNRPSFAFADSSYHFIYGTPVSADVKVACYFAHSVIDGDDFNEPITKDSRLIVEVIGYDENGKETGKSQIDLVKNGRVFADWQTIDLTPLGDCHIFRFNIRDLVGDQSNDYGLSSAAYIAVDNVKVLR